ncbi:MAG: cofactor-independent phosphoglycerate mutase [Candidatus Hinthialibacter antarcticus]|nr:cofactor-independent phosphoglycerate mutase [Candidatus Hinthialibacter antarcticus]
MKYIIAIPDGASDTVSDFPNRQTPLAAADSPLMDELANCGQVGWAQNTPDGMHPGSDVACLSIFGYNPAEIYSGRAPLEAASLGIELGDDFAYRCNLVTIADGKMKEFTAGHISTEEAEALVKSLNEALSADGVLFHPGVQYRHIMQTAASNGEVKCTPPHDILDKDIALYLPQGGSQDFVRGLMEKSIAVFDGHPVNQARLAAGKPAATQIWLWGQGPAPSLQPYSERIGLRGGVITAVDLIRGIGFLAGLEIKYVEGATGLPDTNYEGKAEAALEVLQKDDFVIVHVESTDEMGHAGDLKMKTQSVHDFDQRMLRILIDGLRGRGEDFRVLLLPDHPTPISIRTHNDDPVPFLLYDSRSPEVKGEGGYSEWAVNQRSQKVLRGFRLLDALAEKINIEDETIKTYSIQA